MRRFIAITTIWERTSADYDAQSKTVSAIFDEDTPLGDVYNWYDGCTKSMMGCSNLIICEADQQPEATDE